MKPWQRLTDIIGDLAIIDEMSKKYRNTILGISNPEDKTYRPKYAWYSGINNDQTYHMLKDKDGNKIQLATHTDYEVFIPDPPRGMYNTKCGAVLFYRKPFRQHKRGLGDGTAAVERLDQVVIGNLPRNYFESYIFDVLEDSLNRRIPLDHAFQLAQDKGTAAVTRTFAIALSTSSPHGYDLYYENYLIGRMDDKHVTVCNPVFYQEVLDTQHEWCPDHIIEVINHA